MNKQNSPQKRKLAILDTIKAYQIIRGYATTFLKKDLKDPVNIQELSDLISKSKGHDLYEREIQWGLQSKFLHDFIKEVKLIGKTPKPSVKAKFIQNFTALLTILERRLKDYNIYGVEFQRFQNEIDFWLKNLKGQKLRKQPFCEEKKIKIEVLNDFDSSDSWKKIEHNQDILSFPFSLNQKAKTGKHKSGKKTQLSQRTTNYQSYKNSQLNFNYNYENKSRKAQKKVLKKRSAMRKYENSNQTDEKHHIIVHDVEPQPDTKTENYQNDSLKSQRPTSVKKKKKKFGKFSAIVSPLQQKQKKQNQRYTSDNWKSLSRDDINYTMSINHPSQKKSYLKRPSMKLYKNYKKVIPSTRSIFFRRRKFKGVKKGQIKKRKNSIQLQIDSQIKQNQGNDLKLNFKNENKFYQEAFEKKQKIKPSQKKKPRATVYKKTVALSRKSENYSSSDLSFQSNHEEEIEVITDKDRADLAISFQHLINQQKSSFFKHQQYLSERENQNFQQHLKRMFFQEAGLFKEPFSIEKSIEFKKHSKILELEREYAFEVDNQWIKSYRTFTQDIQQIQVHSQRGGQI